MSTSTVVTDDVTADVTRQHDVSEGHEVVTGQGCDLHQEGEPLTRGNFSSPPAGLDAPEGKTTAIAAVIKCMPEKNAGRHRVSNKHKTKKIVRVLLDSGSDGDLLFHKKGKTMLLPYSKRLVPLSWHTLNGIFQTEKRAEVELKFFDYSDSKTFRASPDVVEYEGTRPQYDLILGCKSMKELGVVLDFKDKTITLDSIILPMRNINNLQKAQKLRALQANNALAQEPTSTREATKRVVGILDANYQKADVRAIVDTHCNHLNTQQKEQLLSLLLFFEQLFDGSLGDWKTKPVSFQLKEGAKPYHGRAFPVPKIHMKTLMKEIQWLVDLGVLEVQHDSQWAAPSFIQPKKNGTVRFLSDFREVNKRLVRKPWPIPKISTVLQELEGFRFATALDLNMGYYTIRLDPDASRICTIIFPWGKYSYKRLPMGIAGSPDIFQAKMSELMMSLEYVRTYLDDLLIISNGSFEDHLDKLKVVFQRLSDAGLKVNADKCTFCADEIEYLGYVLTRDGIKPQKNKVQAILALLPKE